MATPKKQKRQKLPIDNIRVKRKISKRCDLLVPAHFAPQYFLTPEHPLTIAVIGAGGTGSNVIGQLARINYALLSLGHPGLHVIVTDGDKVSETNVGRQLFSPVDIGRYKSEVLVERINRFYGFDWSYHDENANSLINAHINITCVDDFKTRLNLWESCGILHGCYYWMDFGNTVDRGQVIFGTLNHIKQPESKIYDTCQQLPNFYDVYKNFVPDKVDNEPSCSMAESLARQDLFVNSTLAQFGCNLIWKLIREAKIHFRGGYLNFQSFNFKPIKL